YPQPRRHQSWVNSWAHTAIMPTNSVREARAAASSTKIFNIAVLHRPEHMKNNVLFLFTRQGEKSDPHRLG
ncbi:hypothetical protein ABTL78_20025, partial [Acinetobacter baumannii]